MSAANSFDGVKFIASQGDPGRAPALKPEEYRLLVSALETVVVPILERSAGVLKQQGFEVRVESLRGITRLFVRRKLPPMEAALRFQVHKTFAVLTKRAPVFWMFTVYRGHELIVGTPGRLHALDNPPAMRLIADQFAAACVKISSDSQSLQRATLTARCDAEASRFWSSQRKIKPRAGLAGWTQSLPAYPLPEGVPNCEPVTVTGTRYNGVHVRNATGLEWNLTRCQVDCGAIYLLPSRNPVPESDPACLDLIRRYLWDRCGNSWVPAARRRVLTETRYLIWVLARNGRDVTEFDEPLADLQIAGEVED